MNIGYIIMILASVIVIASGVIYGFREIWWMVLVFGVLFAVVLLTRKKR